MNENNIIWLEDSQISIILWLILWLIINILIRIKFLWNYNQKCKYVENELNLNFNENSDYVNNICMNKR